jgi:hypothetical protein
MRLTLDAASVLLGRPTDGLDVQWLTDDRQGADRGMREAFVVALERRQRGRA